MKVGYSLLWGEFLQAADLDYSLTTDLQVVCPCCNESIFKVERRLGDGSLSHYLSHRAAGDDLALAEAQRRCELRVASMTHAEMATESAGSRGQALETFLEDLRGRVDRYVDAMRPHPGPGLFRDAVSALADDAQFRGLATGMRAIVGAARLAEIEDYLLDPDIAQRHFKEIPGLAIFEIGPNLLAEGARFGRDLLAHLQTAQAAPNWRYVAAAALIHGQAPSPNAPGAGPPKPLAEAVAAKTPQLDGKTADAFLEDLGRAWLYPVVAGYGPLRAKTERRRLVRAMHARAREANPELGRGDYREGGALIERHACEWLYKSVVNLVFMLPFTDVIQGYMTRLERGEMPLSLRAAIASAKPGDPLYGQQNDMLQTTVNERP
jgi:hypothetical protein